MILDERDIALAIEHRTPAAVGGNAGKPAEVARQGEMETVARTDHVGENR